MPPATLDRVFCRARETASPATLIRAMMEVSSTPRRPRVSRVSPHSRSSSATTRLTADWV